METPLIKRTLGAVEFQRLGVGARVLARDRHGLKVLELADGTICKLFRRKRWWSSALLFPYAAQFVRNAARLRRCGVPSVTVTQLLAIPELKRQAVIYHKLEGVPLRELLATRPELLGRFAEFLARLHQKGIYFRSLHFGNVLLLPDGELGLIDIQDLRRVPWPLGVGPRVRNFHHFWKYPPDAAALVEFGGERFVTLYQGACASAVGRAAGEEFLKIIDGASPTEEQG